jgi:hypothetical protein
MTKRVVQGDASASSAPSPALAPTPVPSGDESKHTPRQSALFQARRLRRFSHLPEVKSARGRHLSPARQSRRRLLPLPSWVRRHSPPTNVHPPRSDTQEGPTQSEDLHPTLLRLGASSSPTQIARTTSRGSFHGGSAHSLRVVGSPSRVSMNNLRRPSSPSGVV